MSGVEGGSFKKVSIYATTFCSNWWLKFQRVPFCLLVASYKGQPRIILVTRAKHRSDETFTPFSECPEDRVVKGRVMEWDERLKDVGYAYHNANSLYKPHTLIFSCATYHPPLVFTGGPWFSISALVRSSVCLPSYYHTHSLIPVLAIPRRNSNMVKWSDAAMCMHQVKSST